MTTRRLVPLGRKAAAHSLSPWSGKGSEASLQRRHLPRTSEGGGGGGDDDTDGDSIHANFFHILDNIDEHLLRFRATPPERQRPHGHRRPIRGHATPFGKEAGSRGERESAQAPHFCSLTRGPTFFIFFLLTRMQCQ